MPSKGLRFIWSSMFNNKILLVFQIQAISHPAKDLPVKACNLPATSSPINLATLKAFEAWTAL